MPLTQVQPGMLGTPQPYSFKNRIINGGMVIDQRNAGASVTPSNGQYLVDRWQAIQEVASKYSAQQNAGSITSPAGFVNYLGITSLSAYSVGAGEQFRIRQFIEGYNIADLAWGTADAKTVTLSFWVRSSLTGTFGGALQNSASNRSYPFSYTISSANTWEQKSITIAGDTTGTWLTTNGAGIQLTFGLGVGSTYSGTAGAWVGSAIASTTGATSVVGTNGATFYITGVQLEVGSSATTFDYRPYGTELALCQRYYVKDSPNTGMASGSYMLGMATTGIGARMMMRLPVAMRTEPTISYQNCRIYCGSVAPAVTSIAAQQSTTTMGAASWSASAGGFTAGYAALLIEDSGTSFVTYSAEL